MEKICIDDVKIGREISESGPSGIFSKSRVENKDRDFISEAVKLVCPRYIDILASNGLSLEDKVLNSHSFDNLSEIVVPSMAVYDSRDNYMGYVMKCVDGETYGQYCCDRFFYVPKVACNLSIYFNEFKALESIVMRDKSIVFADLLDKYNIMYDGESFRFIDYDGIQCNGYLSDLYVLNRDKYVGTKYVNNDCFTKDFDIKQLFSLYFNVVFGYDLSMVDYSNDVSHFIDSDLSRIGLDSDRVKDYVLKLYSNCDNGLLSDILSEISDNYELCIDNDSKRYVKRKVKQFYWWGYGKSQV